MRTRHVLRHSLPNSSRSTASSPTFGCFRLPVVPDPPLPPVPPPPPPPCKDRLPRQLVPMAATTRAHDGHLRARAAQHLHPAMQRTESLSVKSPRSAFFLLYNSNSCDRDRCGVGTLWKGHNRRRRYVDNPCRPEPTPPHTNRHGSICMDGDTAPPCTGTVTLLRLRSDPHRK